MRWQKPNLPTARLRPLSVSPTCVVLTMDGTLAVQDGLLEDGPSSGATAHPDALPTPLGSPAPPDQWDEGQCQSPAPLRAADVLPLSGRTWRGDHVMGETDV